VIALRVAAPAAGATGGLPLALLIALTVTVLVAIGLNAVTLRRNSRLTALAGWLSAASAMAVIASALLVGGALTPSPTAVAEPVPAAPTVSAPRGAAAPGPVSQLDGRQLATLPLPAGSTANGTTPQP
jgi:hypothetical protein